ncbi:MAG: TlpA family protein disulfide reductase [Bacteroidota bacterium]
MTKPNPHRKRRRSGSPALMAGAGLILIAAAVLLLGKGPGNPGGASAGPAERSVVPVAVNFTAPALELENVAGGTQSLADYTGSVLLVNNWATWCPPCKAEMPTLQSYYEAYAAEGFMIVAIESGDSRESVVQFARAYGLGFSVWLDPNGDSLRVFGNGNLPNSYVIDRSGTVRYAWTGQISRAMLERYVTPLLAKSN